LPTGQVTVSVVVIVFDDAARLPAAVASALAQELPEGPAGLEVVVVDDASSDGSGEVAEKLAAADPRVRVVRRAENSGGCGTPRNDGLAAARGTWVCFLDSDDMLPPGAVGALLSAATRHDADVAAGLCVRRELPEGRDVPWQPDLYARARVQQGLAGEPRLLWDTLSVNKLYRRALLTGRDIRFPDGDAHYEDFVFSARVYAAASRIVRVPDTVYVWHVRREAAATISLRRDRITNWLDRLAAHREVVAAMRATGDPALVAHAQAKFADHDLRLYLRDLPRRTPEYRQEWLRATREHLASFGAAGAGAEGGNAGGGDAGGGDGLAAARPAARWAARVLLARAEPELGRLAELSADPARLLPPYAGDAAAPRWDDAEPAVPLAGLGTLPLAELPLCAEARLQPGRGLRLRLTVYDLYGRLAEAGVRTFSVELRARDGRVHRSLPVDLAWETREDGADSGGGAGGGGRLHGAVVIPPDALRPGLDGDPDAFTVWNVWLRGEAPGKPAGEGSVSVRVRAVGVPSRRRMALGSRGALTLTQARTSPTHSLAVRVARGLPGVGEVVSARIRRARIRRGLSTP
jgi:glycosyltransferase involved in cell wall biosynthesis